MQEQTSQSILTLEGRKRITLTRVESVDSFSDSAILLTVEGKRMTINGEKLKILAFSQGNGNFCASGDVTAIKYSAAKKISKLFK